MLKVLIIDDYPEFRQLLRHHLTVRWPDALVIEHDPTIESLPAGFDGSGYDIVLLDYNLGQENGLDYLRRFRRIPQFPPIIFLTAEGTERLAVEAIKLGAADYLPKQKLQNADLVSAVQEALDARGSVERFENALHFDEGPPAPRIPGLRTLHRLGSGGTSTVYLVERLSDGEKLVLKVLDVPKAGREGMVRFFREYQIVSTLCHPRIVCIFEQAFKDDLAYVLMEYFPAGSLKERIARGIRPDEAVSYALQIAEALGVIHEAGVLHRDLKPANVMFREDGSLVLIDFGIARQTEQPLDVTVVGTVMGTPHYMSPEQADAQPRLDARADLYALGVILYQMLTGEVPYNARTPVAVIYKHRHSEIPRLPPALQALQPVIDCLLAKRPEDRFPTAAATIAALRGVAL